MNEKEYKDFIEKWKEDNKGLIDSGKCRKTFIECLPRNRNKGVSWSDSVGYKIHFMYNSIEGDIIILNYVKENQYKLKVSYNKNEYYIYPDDLKKSNIKKILTVEAVIGQVFKDDKRNLIITDMTIKERSGRDKYIKKDKYYKYKCNKCGWNEGWIERSSLLRGNGCLCCCGKIVVEGINDIPTTAPWMVKYFQGGYDEAKLYTKYGSGNINNKDGKINPICPNCKAMNKDYKYIGNMYKDKGYTCPKCSDGISYPNKFMFNILEQLNINFKTEYSPKWMKPKRYDFYFEINNKKYIIEMDGEFHYKNNHLNGQTAKQSQEIDDYKDKLAKEYSIEVIRIDCNYDKLKNRFEYIKENILHSKLNNIFDLNSIDWDKCNNESLKTNINKACDLWNKGISSTKEIANKMKIDKTTVVDYLNIGYKLNLCNYNSIEQKQISLSKMLKASWDKNSIQLYCKNADKIFNSIQDCMNYCKEYLNINISASTIQRRLNTNNKNTSKTIYKDFYVWQVKNLTEENRIKYKIEDKLKEINK